LRLPLARAREKQEKTRKKPAKNSKNRSGKETAEPVNTPRRVYRLYIRFLAQTLCDPWKINLDAMWIDLVRFRGTISHLKRSILSSGTKKASFKEAFFYRYTHTKYIKVIKKQPCPS